LLSGKIYNVSARVARPELDGIVHVGSEAVASWSPALQEMRHRLGHWGPVACRERSFLGYNGKNYRGNIIITVG